MNSKLAQLTTLVTFANDYLCNGRIDKSFLKKKCFYNCNWINFIDFNKVDLADDPNEWFIFLKKDKCLKLRLNFQHSEHNAERPDHFYAGYIDGGGTWMIESVYSDHSRYWSVHWENNYPFLRDRQVFDIFYRRQFKQHPVSELRIEVELVKKRLGSALWNISEFANSQGYEKWSIFFNDAMDTLYGSEPGNSLFFNDILPAETYSLSEQQLIFSAGKAWCFGQEGSWNDIQFKDKYSTERYMELSGKLYDEIITSIMTVTNK